MLKKGFELGLQQRQLMNFLSVQSLRPISIVDIIENIEYHFPFLADYVKKEMGTKSYPDLRYQSVAYRTKLFVEAEILWREIKSEVVYNGF